MIRQAMAFRCAFLLTAAPLLLLGACDSGDPKGNGSAAAVAEQQHAAESSRDELGPAPVLNLAADGLEPGLPFGTPKAAAIATASKTFGLPTDETRVEECGAGPMDFVRFHGLSLAFQHGRFAGWSLSEKFPSVATSGGLTVRAPRSVLGGAAVERSTLGPEFELGGIGGLLDEKEREVVALWAGLTCHFR